jgi:lipoprotein-anchoring transpeptidase ErfK/SrfK
MRSTLALAFVLPAAALWPLAACTESQDGASAQSDGHASTSSETPQGADPGAQDDGHQEPDPVARAAARGDIDAGPYDGPLIGAMFMQTPIMSDMEWPVKESEKKRGLVKDIPEARLKVTRIGYIRHGGKAPVIPHAHVKENCPDGWYELLAGGFVCGKYATLDLNHPRVRLAPHPPFVDQPLPYEYGYNLTNGTPLYRSVPSKEERLKLEPWLAAKPKPAPAPAGEPSERDLNPYATTEDLDAGATPVALAGPSRASKGDPLGIGIDARDGGTPWYLRQYDGGKPAVTLDDLRGEAGPIVRRMVRGFYLALDKEFKTPSGARWWRTTAGFAVPYERIMVQKPLTDFRGTWIVNEPAPEEPSPENVAAADATDEAASALDAGVALATDGGLVGTKGPNAAQAAAPGKAQTPASTPKKPITKLPVAFVRSSSAMKYAVRADRKFLGASGELPRNSVVGLTGESMTVGGAIYDETIDGFWMRRKDGVRTEPSPRPADIGPNEKWIDVNLTNQTLVAFEGDRAVYATLISSGRRDKNNKDRDYPTPVGTFAVREKHIAATMDGDVASDGPYSIEDVPWIMYFKGSYALHGAFWHGSFGRERSHGCVNLTPADARELFNWTEPRLPQGWHAVWATPERPGTRIVVHE